MTHLTEFKQSHTGKVHVAHASARYSGGPLAACSRQGALHYNPGNTADLFKTAPVNMQCKRCLTILANREKVIANRRKEV